MSSVHPSDLQIVSTWASETLGEIIDAGCGPGHWTNFLAQRGSNARGIDRVPEFIAHSASSYPALDFAIEDLDSVVAADNSVGGILAWYSLIHYEPSDIHVPLREFSRVVRPGGSLLVGFFEGPAVEKFDHAVTPAYRWSVDAITAELAGAGFEIVESFVRNTAGERPQAAVRARRQDASTQGLG